MASEPDNVARAREIVRTLKPALEATLPHTFEDNVEYVAAALTAKDEECRAWREETQAWREETAAHGDLLARDDAGRQAAWERIKAAEKALEAARANTDALAKKNP